jgi:hypothetical protein
MFVHLWLTSLHPCFLAGQPTLPASSSLTGPGICRPSTQLQKHQTSLLTRRGSCGWMFQWIRRRLWEKLGLKDVGTTVFAMKSRLYHNVYSSYIIIAAVFIQIVILDSCASIQTKSAWSRHAVYEIKLYYRPQLFEVIWQKKTANSERSLYLSPSLSLNCLALGG